MVQGTDNFQYTRRVLIQHQRARHESDDSIVAPVIRIERQSLENSARSVNKYVLPLDAAWEFPRENLKLGKVSTCKTRRLKEKCHYSAIHSFWVWAILARLCRQQPLIIMVKQQMLQLKCSKTIILTR